MIALYDPAARNKHQRKQVYSVSRIVLCWEIYRQMGTTRDKRVRFENAKPGIKAVDDRNKAINIRDNEDIVNHIFIPILSNSSTNSLKPCSKTNKNRFSIKYKE